MFRRRLLLPLSVPRGSLRFSAQHRIAKEFWSKKDLVHRIDFALSGGDPIDAEEAFLQGVGYSRMGRLFAAEARHAFEQALKLCGTQDGDISAKSRACIDHINKFKDVPETDSFFFHS
jgi:hypothetical protein